MTKDLSALIHALVTTSKMRKRRKTMVAGGEKERHSCQSWPRQERKWLMARNRAWMDMSAMYN